MISTTDKINCKPFSQDSIPTFIRKTYGILEERKFPDIIDWNPEGTALVIKKASEFCQKVLPCYFKHNNLTSFVRQLNMYNFRKKRTHSLDYIYYHELFQRGKKHLLKEIKRKTPDSNLERSFRTPELSDYSQENDASSLAYENQMLKNLCKDTMARVQALENQIKELNSQNQSLWNQIYKNGENQTASNFFFNQTQENTNLQQDQFPTTSNNVHPSHDEYGAEHQTFMQSDATFVKPNTMLPYSNGNNEYSNESTDTSQHNVESDRGLEWAEFTPFTAYNQEFFPEDTFQSQTLQVTQSQVMVPSEEQINAWDNIQLRNDLNKDTQIPIQNHQAYSVLGKRQLETVNTDSQLHGLEPFPKRLEVCYFNKNRLDIQNEGMGQMEIKAGNYSWNFN